MNDTDHDNLTITMEMTKSNAKAIEGLTKTIDQLAKVLEKEDSKQRELIQKLMNNADKCEMRHQDFLKRFDNKANAIAKLESKIEARVEKHIFDRVVNRLWTIGAGVLALMVGSMGYMIKILFEGIKNG